VFIYGISAVHPIQSKGSTLGLIGMGLIAEGVLNVIPFGSLAGAMYIVTSLAAIAAQLGYGVPMSQKK
jgi:hypothetical protein